MIRISITASAFEAIAATLPLGSVSFEGKPGANGERQIWLEPAVVNRLRALRGPGDSYSDVIPASEGLRGRPVSGRFTISYCNAVHQGLKRIGSAPALAAKSMESVRAVFHGAMAIYLIRYLNVHPARLPGEGDDRLKDWPLTVEEIRAALLDASDRQHRVGEAAWRATSHWVIHRNRSLPRWRMRCCAKTQVFTHTRFLKLGCVSSTNGPTQNRSGIS